MPIYKMKNLLTGEPIGLVDARLPSQAQAHGARLIVGVEVAKPHDLIEMTKAGFNLETVGSAGQQPDLEDAERREARQETGE